MHTKLEDKTYTVCDSQEQCKELFEWAKANGIKTFSIYRAEEQMLVYTIESGLFSDYEQTEHVVSLHYQKLPLFDFISRLKGGIKNRPETPFKVGQAVMYSNNHMTFLSFISNDTLTELIHGCNIIGQYEQLNMLAKSASVRPATKEEILSHIQENEFRASYESKESFFSPNNYLRIYKSDVWKWEDWTTVKQSGLKEYCKEGLMVARIVDALNLTN